MLAYPKAEGIPLYMDKLYEYGITMAAPDGFLSHFWAKNLV